MNENERFYYSEEEMMVSLETFLENLKGLRYDSKYKSLLGEEFISRLNSWDREIRQRRDDPFTVVVVGDFKRGKSMLINALLREEVVPTNVTPETVTLNRISYGAHSNEAVLSGNRRMRLSDSELNRSELEQVLSGLNEKVERLELKRENPMLKKITIIDTPGLGDAMEDFTGMVKQSLLQADAVIYVFNAMYPLSMSEQIFLRSAVIPQKYTSLFLVANFTDVLKNQKEYDRVRETIRERTEALLPGAPVWMVSALDEVCRATGEERPRPAMQEVLEAQFDDLRLALDELIVRKADSVVLDRMQRLTTAMIRDLSHELDVLEKGLSMTAQDAVAQRERFRKEKEENVAVQSGLLRSIDDQVGSFKREASAWMGDFLNRMMEETGNLTSMPQEDVRKYYEVYCIDLLEKALTVCTELHQEQLYDLLDRESSELSGKLAYGMNTDTRFSFRFQLDARIWTKGDTASLALSMLDFNGLLGTVASLAADGVAGMMREQESEQRKPEILDQITSQMTSLTISVRQTIEKVYTDFGEEAKKLVMDYFSDQLAASEKALEQAVRVAMKEEEKKEELRAMIQSVRDMLEDADFAQSEEIPEEENE